MTDLELRQQCTEFFHSHRQAKPAQHLAAMAAWCEENNIDADVYGAGDYLQAFEAKIAALTGFEAAMFCITGTMAQMIALRLACEQRASEVVAMHASCHILLHEQNNYQMLGQFKTQTLGEPFRPWLASDLEKIPGKLAAALYELPMREIGGQMPDWEQLADIKQVALTRGTHLHLDGARLWEAACGYGKSPAEVCEGFASAYVSFYKGIGSVGGAMLLGSSDFIAQARVWMHRFGGNIYQRMPYAVSAAMQFDARLAAMPQYRQKTQEVLALIAKHPELRINPAQPQCNLFHLYFPVAAQTLNEIRNQIAREEKAWLFANGRNTALAGQSMVELYIGDNMLALSNERIAQLLQLLAAKMRLA
ncbi:MAG: threonine aldolase [Burkholderiales bacterium]|nr:threonine aldolase [Burkholderiales bacterium]